MTDLVHNKLPENINRFVIAYILIYWKCHPSLCPFILKANNVLQAQDLPGSPQELISPPSHACKSDGIFPPAAKGKRQWEPGRSWAGADPGGSKALVIASLVLQGILGIAKDSSGSNSWKQYRHLVGRSHEGGWISYRAGQAYHRTLSGLRGQCQGRETKSSSLHVAVIRPVVQPAGERERGCLSHWEDAWSSLRTL